ncbi:4Fe-4S dicluster domain-containing protein [Thermodesulfobacteriota bacterium]
MDAIKIKKGYRAKIKGSPNTALEELASPSRVAVLPERIPFLKPRLQVKIGDPVKIGSVLFLDKRNTDLKFLSPGGGRVTQINFGPRRVIKEIVIDLDEKEKYEEFETIDDEALAGIKAEKLVNLLMAGGLWPFIRELPFRDIAQPDSRPPAILVSLDAQEPFQPFPEIYLKGNEDLFRFGVKILMKLTDRVILFTHADNSFTLTEFEDILTYKVIGDYPADDPGVLLYHIKRSSAENLCWYVNGQDVLLLAGLVKNGRYPIARVMVASGSFAKSRQHFRTRLGVPLGHLSGKNAENGDTRYVVGGIFRGFKGSPNTFMGLYETALAIIPEGNEKEFLALFNPGFSKPSYSRTFLSSFNKSDMEYDCSQHGGDRACIACGHCEQVCPVDIFPQLTYKSILAGEVEEYLAHGLLDCVECGLCSYVCPAKIELYATLKSAKATYYSER